MAPPRSQLRTILRSRDFRRLYLTRLSSQFADGLFQAGLAGSVLFNPDRQTQATSVALGFAVLLLPYSVLGPFVGVLLDRWSRRTVLTLANLTRAALVPAVSVLIWLGHENVLYFLGALIIIGVNRFVLAGLSASLPHVVPTDHLATANSLSTTSGTVVFSAGLGVAVGAQSFLGGGNHGYAIASASAALAYLVSAAAAVRFGRNQLGPDEVERAQRSTIGKVVRGMVSGVRHLVDRRSAGYALIAMSANRFFFGIATIMTLLLYRNYFTDSGVFRAGALGLGQVVVLSGLGAFIAALITPMAIRRMEPRLWISVMVFGVAVVQLLLGTPFIVQTIVFATMLVALASQAIKIVVDTTMQSDCDDGFRGRVFSVYDTLFNVCYVSGLVLGAVLLPESGKSHFVLGIIVVGCGIVGTWYFWVSGRWARRPAVGAAPSL